MPKNDTTPAGYTRFGDVNDHIFAAFLRKVSNKLWDYEQCGTYTIFLLPHKTERSKYKALAVVSYDNRLCTKNVTVPDEYAPVLTKMIGDRDAKDSRR